MELMVDHAAMKKRWPEFVPSVEGLELVHRGKVRDLYAAAPDRFLMVASDRISAFDVVMDQLIIDKGRVLTQLSLFWFELLADIVANHVRGIGDDERSLLVARAEMVPIECIVRGYLSGSAWKEYRAKGTVHGSQMPEGLRESAQLPIAIFTPSTKAELGIHDENISFDRAIGIVGNDVAHEVKAMSLAIYDRASKFARERGVIIADTKFEFGYVNGELTLCDEVLTPDSSRFWPMDQWEVGTTPPALDKQPLRDWLETMNWDKTPPAPPLPPAVIAETEVRYRDCYERLTGSAL